MASFSLRECATGNSITAFTHKRALVLVLLSLEVAAGCSNGADVPPKQSASSGGSDSRLASSAAAVKPSVEVLSCRMKDVASGFGASGNDLIVGAAPAPRGKTFLIIVFKLSSPLTLPPLPVEALTWLGNNKSYPLAEAQQREAELAALKKKYANEFEQQQSFERQLWPVAHDRQGNTYKPEVATFGPGDTGLDNVVIEQGSATFIVPKDLRGFLLDVPGHSAAKAEVGP